MSVSLVVDNTDTVKYKVLSNLMDDGGKEVSVLHAIRNIPDMEEAFKALNVLLHAGLIERKVQPTRSNVDLVYYRYRSEIGLLRKYEESVKSA